MRFEKLAQGVSVTSIRCSIAMSAEYLSKFEVLHRLWWMSKYERKLSNGTKHTPKKTLKVQEGRDIWFIHNKNRSTFGIIAHSIHLMKISCLVFFFLYAENPDFYFDKIEKTFRQYYVRLNLVNYLVFCVIHHAIGVYQTICFLSLIIRTHINFIVKPKKK